MCSAICSTGTSSPVMGDTTILPAFPLLQPDSPLSRECQSWQAWDRITSFPCNSPSGAVRRCNTSTQQHASRHEGITPMHKEIEEEQRVQTAMAFPAYSCSIHLTHEIRIHIQNMAGTLLLASLMQSRRVPARSLASAQGACSRARSSSAQALHPPRSP